MIQTSKGAVHIDPGIMWKDAPSTPAKAALILVSHSHRDHLNLKLVKELAGPDTDIFAAPKAAKVIGQQAHALNPGESAEHDGITVHAVHAYNPRGSRLITYHKKGHCLGFIIEADGLRLYHAGDTGLIPEMNDLGPVDVAMLPIGGQFTMDVAEAADAVRLIRPKITIPMHNLRTDPVRLAEALGAEHRVVVLKAGESFTPS